MVLEPDGAALRKLCRQRRLLLAEWRGLCVRACSKPPAMPPIWPETASDEASTSSHQGVGDILRELENAYDMSSEGGSRNVPVKARKKKRARRQRMPQCESIDSEDSECKEYVRELEERYALDSADEVPAPGPIPPGARKGPRKAWRRLGPASLRYWLQ